MLISLLVAGALVVSLDPDGVVATAPTGQQSVPVGAEAPVAPDVPSVSTQAVTAHGLTTDEQIDRWVGQRAEAGKPFSSGMDPWRALDDRKVHGQVSAGIGTGDYSAYSATVSLPIGDSGRLDLTYSQSKNDPYGYGYGYPGPGYGYHGGGYGGYGGGGRGGESRSFGVGYSYDSSVSRRDQRFEPSWDLTSRQRRAQEAEAETSDD